MERMKLLQLALRPNVLLSALGMAAGVSGAVAAGHLLQARTLAAEAALNARYRPSEVVVAARDLPAGQLLEPGMLALRRMPTDFIPSGVLTASQAKAIIGERLAIGLRRGDPVQAAIVTSRDNQILSNLVRNGARALTISVDDTNSMSGLLGAGDMVDIYYSRSQNDGAVLAPLLERVEVLAAGEAVANDKVIARGPDPGRGFSTLTILVSPEDAARVVLAQSTGTLTVLLRAPADVSPASVATRNSKLLFVQRRAGVAGDRGIESVELIVGGNGGAVPHVSQMNIGRSPLQGGRT
ncbi:MAG: Flp pilus assembly protein CpaB [Pseudomonadota bacterium]